MPFVGVFVDVSVNATIVPGVPEEKEVPECCYLDYLGLILPQCSHIHLPGFSGNH